MKILGFQEVTVIDYPGRIACTVFLFGCNFRCGFCHNPGLVLTPEGEERSKKSILDFLKKRRAELDGVCFTGGEPLMTLEEDFLRDIKQLGFLIKIDTNGSFPDKLENFIKEKLVDFVSMDIKSGKEKYDEVAGANVDLGKIEESIRSISKMEEYEFRTTVVDGIHDVEEVRKIAEWLNRIAGKKPKRFVLQGFKREAKLLDEEFRKKKNTTEETLREMKDAVKNYFEEVAIRV